MTRGGLAPNVDDDVRLPQLIPLFDNSKLAAPAVKAQRDCEPSPSLSLSLSPSPSLCVKMYVCVCVAWVGPAPGAWVRTCAIDFPRDAAFSLSLLSGRLLMLHCHLEQSLSSFWFRLHHRARQPRQSLRQLPRRVMASPHEAKLSAARVDDHLATHSKRQTNLPPFSFVVEQLPNFLYFRRQA